MSKYRQYFDCAIPCKNIINYFDKMFGRYLASLDWL